jgi:3-oxoacyl-[acyl-carrier protein] reductase
MTDHGLLQSSVAVITGSSRGIGLAVARALAAEGCAVVLNGRDAAAVETAREGLAARGARVATVPGSAADPAVADEMVRVASTFGPVDVLVNCAGTAEPPGSSILTITTDEWHALVEAHLHATFETCRAVAPAMVAAGGGSIVNTSSHAFTGVFGGTGYAAGKGAVNSLTHALAAELHEHGVRVNAVCPGARTRLSTGEDYVRTIEKLHARGILDDLMRTGALEPPPAEYVAPLYTFLASPLAAGVTGEVLVAAGGYLGRFPRPAEEFVAYREHSEAPPWTPQEIADRLRER